ncbi:hypothetical protein GCM10027569_31090 [Flindersiella endophytica]
MWRKTTTISLATLATTLVSMPGVAAASRPAEDAGIAAASRSPVWSEATDSPPLSVTPAGERYGHLEEVTTGRKFVPRGANYVRLTTTLTEHYSTFEPGRYTKAEAEQVLATLGGNSVSRVTAWLPWSTQGCDLARPRRMSTKAGCLPYPRQC